ncbi:MAG: hypothetical protein VSS75_022680 [Candidatus Parabeggiatoa sp.]|nr:hypothetical protein [Candidatus Parabeggiatoa sp.]
MNPKFSGILIEATRRGGNPFWLPFAVKYRFIRDAKHRVSTIRVSMIRVSMCVH